MWPANPVTALFVSVDHVVASPEAVTRREGHDQWRRKPLYEPHLVTEQKYLGDMSY